MGEVFFLLVGVALFGAFGWLMVDRARRNRALADRGRPMQATVTHVRDDRSDMQTIVTYRFDHGGASFERTGVLRRDLPMPAEGSTIDIIFVPDTPKYSRLKFEESAS
jgi:hypothetical protein